MKSRSIIAENIKKYRNKAGISRDSLSKLTSLSYYTIVKIESGVTKAPRQDTLKEIADALDVTIADLVG